MPKKDLGYYQTLPYKIECEFDPEDRSWIVKFPELPGCLAHGKSIATAMARAEKHKNEWLQVALDVGDNIPEPTQVEYNGKLLVRVSRRTHARIATEAATEHVSMNAYVAQAVAEKLERSGLNVAAKEAAAAFYSYLQSRGLVIITTPGKQKAVEGIVEETEKTLEPTKAPDVSDNNG